MSNSITLPFGRIAPRFWQFGLVNVEVLANDQWGRATAQSTVLSSRLIEVPAAGPVLVSPMVSVMPDTATFKSGGDLASWIGLVPRQNSSGGKESREVPPSRRPVTAAAAGGVEPWLSSATVTKLAHEKGPRFAGPMEMWGEALGYASKPVEAKKQFSLAAGLYPMPSEKTELGSQSPHT